MPFTHDHSRQVALVASALLVRSQRLGTRMTTHSNTLLVKITGYLGWKRGSWEIKADRFFDKGLKC